MASNEGSAIDLSHQQELRALFEGMQLNFAEYSFANIFCFGVDCHYRLVKKKNVYLLGQHPQTKEQLLLLMAPPDRLDKQELYEMIEQVDCLYGVPAAWLSFFAHEPFSPLFLPDDSDYLFKVETLRDYRGRKLASKRNLAKQFRHDYQAIAHPLTDERLEDGHQLLELWKEQLPDPTDSDYTGCKKMLLHWGALEGLQGTIWYVKGRPVGLLIGETLGRDTFLINFMKADRDYLGIYQYMYQAIAASLPAELSYINLEEDLGKPNLRQAKRSYGPHALLHKWRLYPSKLQKSGEKRR